MQAFFNQLDQLVAMALTMEEMRVGVITNLMGKSDD
jgi:hypothetical protein